MLGRSWPGRQFEREGWWPGEFNLLMFHAAALPQFLAFVMRLESAANEPTFATVLRASNGESPAPTGATPFYNSKSIEPSEAPAWLAPLASMCGA